MIGYKDFLPKEYIYNRSINENSFYNKLIMFFIIINLSLLPKLINNTYEVNKSVEVINIDFNTEDKSKGEIGEILELIDLNLTSLEIKDGYGTIKIKDKKDIFVIDKIINIKTITEDLDGYYLLGVELWREK